MELGEALNSNEVELHGNYMWHPATWIYAPKLKDLDKKTGYIRQAIDVLNELELPPLEKAHQIIEIPHFGRNIATGLVMVFHPTEFAIYNEQSEGALRKLGYDASTLEVFQESARELKEELGAEDFLELDWFLYLVNQGNFGLNLTKYWWVNQGNTYEQERDGAYLWAPKKTKDGKVLEHHKNLIHLQPGNVILHYAKGSLRAVSEVLETATEASRPAELPAEPWESEGYLVKAKYYELAETIPLESIPPKWRTVVKGPFTKQGAVKQGYLFSVPPTFVERLVERFPSQLPDFLVGGSGKRIVKIAPGEAASFWDECLEGDYICVGWDEVGDLRKYTSKKDFKASFREQYATRYNNQAHISRRANELWTLCELKPGDLIVANKGTSKVLAIGKVLDTGYEWRPDREEHKHTVDVSWDTSVAKDIPPQADWATAVIKDVPLSLYQVIAGKGSPFTKYVEPPFDQIYKAVLAQNMRITERDLRRYHLALKTRGFVILSGVSGTGKTWLTEVYAGALGAEYLLVPVAPNWTTNEDLLGYFNPIDKQYHDTDFSRFLRRVAQEHASAQAEARRPMPYHLVLDEMNLARVEYYFAKFLSAMEVRARNGTANIELGSGEEVVLPPNLYFTGTVNIDETTHGFADRVYDRAQLIEFGASREALWEHLGDVPYRDVLMDIWDAVHEAAPFAFRVLDEIKAYVDESKKFDVSWEEAVDEQLLQKVLPKMKGANLKVGEALEDLETLTENFPLSRAKVQGMRQGFLQHGFVSYF